LRLSLSGTKIAPLPTSHLGPYELLELLGAGGMGEVYRARDTRLDRIVAIKILLSSAADDLEARQRFEREARTISQLNHPHICTLHDVGRQEGIDYLVFEYLEGETLARRLSNGPLPIHEALAVAIQVADALDRAHRAGIVHRDLKPGNIMLVAAGRRSGSSIARHPRNAATAAGQPLAKLLDFGIAKPRAAVTGFSSSASRSAIPGDVQPTLGAPLTAQGAILGTVQYMAPELIEGHDADPRTDIWAFGCILYEMLSGEPPFDRKTQPALIAAILEREPRPLPEALPSLPPRLWEITRVCLEKDPANRWQSVRDLLRELRWSAQDVSTAERQSVSTPTTVARRIGRRSAIVAGAVLAIVVAAAALSAPRFAAVSSGRTGPPVIVLIDSPHPERVYDPETRRTGGTNADDLTDLLRDLPVVLLKENTNATWHREKQVLQENPTLVVAHRSAFYDTTLFDPAKYGDVGHTQQFAELAHDKFDLFIGYIGEGNPRTRFVVYSRGSWDNDAASAQWIRSMEERFPTLRGRVQSMKVPLDRATFRDMTTGDEIRKLIETALKESQPR
jgi:serine/threonine protein kinase